MVYHAVISHYSTNSIRSKVWLSQHDLLYPPRDVPSVPFVSSVKATNVSNPCGCVTNESSVWYLMFFLCCFFFFLFFLNWLNTETLVIPSRSVVLWFFQFCQTMLVYFTQHHSTELNLTHSVHILCQWAICWVVLILWHSLPTTLTGLCWAQKLPLWPCS